MVADLHVNSFENELALQYGARTELVVGYPQGADLSVQLW
jgi:hypothetical protein